MKTTHQKQIKTFLKKEADKIYVPFLKSFSKSGKVAQIFQKMMDILPTIKKAKDKNTEADKKVLPPIQLNDVKPKFNNPLVLKASQTVVKLPQVDKEKLVSMVKNKEILNRLESPSKNQYVLTVPAYEDGKNVKNELSKLINVTSPKHQARLEQEAGNNAIQDTGRNLEIAKADALVAASKTTPAKLEPNATKAGGSSGAKITVVGDKAKEASLVGEKQGEVEAITKTAVLPEKKVEDAAEAAFATQANAATPEEAGSGAKRGGEALADMASTALSFVPGLGAVGGALKGLKGMGAVGKMAGMAKGMGGGSPLSAIAKGGGGLGGALGAAAGGGGGGLGGALGAAAGGGGGLGGMLGAVGGGLGGLAGAAAMATPVGMALAAAPAIGAAAGGLASGIGSAIGGIASAYGSIGGALIGGIFGNGGKEKESKPVVVQGNGAAPMSVTNITYQYDIYRKTADDSFMLPNYRREYG
jgi:hypothetical protein